MIKICGTAATQDPTHHLPRFLRACFVSVSKEVHNQKLCNMQKSLWLARIIYCLQRKTPKCKYWAVKVLCLETQMVCSSMLKNDSLYLLLYRSSKCCVASRCNGLGLYTQRLDQQDCFQHWEQQMHHASVWILSWQCKSEIISLLGTQWTWRWWEI